MLFFINPFSPIAVTESKITYINSRFNGEKLCLLISKCMKPGTKLYSPLLFHTYPFIGNQGSVPTGNQTSYQPKVPYNNVYCLYSPAVLCQNVKIILLVARCQISLIPSVRCTPMSNVYVFHYKSRKTIEGRC